MFGDKDKQPKPQAGRKCPFFHIGGNSASGCIEDRCAMWQDDQAACVFKVLAAAASAQQ